MQIAILVLIIVSMSVQSVAKKAYNQKMGEKGALLFTAVSVLAAAGFFICAGERPFAFSKEWLSYALWFAFFYGLSAVASFIAIQCGSLSLTSLAVSYSLIIPTIYGLIFLQEPSGVWLYLGIILLMISLVLINAKDGDARISLKWAIWAFLAFFGNGACTTVQKVQQLVFDGAAKNEFMIVAMLAVSVVLLGLSFATERKDWVFCLKKGAGHMVFSGVVNGVMNLFVMILAGMMAASVMYPLISAGGILLTALISRVFYGEKLTARQNIGLLLGVGAVVFLNI